MTSFKTPGFIKLWFKDDCLETKYSTIQDIPLLGIDKKEKYISPAEPQEKIAILHYNDSLKARSLQEKLTGVKGIRVYAVPDQNSSQTFKQLDENMGGKTLGKMIFNGQTSHPLFKFLKKNCDDFYDYDTNSASKSISGKVGLFVSSQNGVRYYAEKDIENYISSLNS